MGFLVMIISLGKVAKPAPLCGNTVTVGFAHLRLGILSLLCVDSRGFGGGRASYFNTSSVFSKLGFRLLRRA